MSESQNPQTEHSSFESADSSFLGGAGPVLQAYHPPQFNVSAGPIQRHPEGGIDYEPYVTRIIPILREVQSYAGRPISQELRAIKGDELAAIFREVQEQGGTTGEFMDAITTQAGGTGIFNNLYQNLNEIGLDWVLEGATGKRVKNLHTGDLYAHGGGQSFSIRSSPRALADGSNILGELNHSMELLGPVTRKQVDEETNTEFMGIQVRREGLEGLLLNDGTSVATLPETIWVGAGGLRVTVKWHVFMEQLSNFDVITTGMSLSDKLTKLRQFGQKKDIGKVMDGEIGTRHRQHGPRYQDDRQSYSNIFQLLKEVDQVETPLGVVDMHHFLTAIESYKTENREEDVDPYWRDFGKMKDVGSYSGNIGAAAAEFVLRNSTNYERTVGNGASDAERLRFYYDTRTTEEELLGELDGWGALGALESGRVNTLTDLINGYYGGGVPTPQQQAGGQAHPRKAAMLRFISHYGLSTEGGSLNHAGNVDIFYGPNLIFAQGWWKSRKDTFGEESEIGDLNDPTRRMTWIFVRWLDQKAREYGSFE